MQKENSTEEHKEGLLESVVKVENMLEDIFREEDRSIEDAFNIVMNVYLQTKMQLLHSFKLRNMPELELTKSFIRTVDSEITYMRLNCENTPGLEKVLDPANIDAVTGGNPDLVSNTMKDLF